MIEILYLTLTFFGVWVGVTGWFFAMAHAIHLRDEGVEFTWMIKVPMYVYLVVGVLFDVAFNWLFGTLIFMEFPREFLFTHRVKRHKEDGNPKADRWVEILNKIEPGHV